MAEQSPALKDTFVSTDNDHRQRALDIEVGTATSTKSKGRQATKRPNASGSTDEAKPLTSKPSTRKTKPTTLSSSEHGAAIKYGSLILLVAQMVGLVLLMRYTRTKGANQSADGTREMYLASTAVFMMEVVKLLICVVVVFFQSGSTLSGLASSLHQHIWMSPMEVVKLCVPSLLYTIQNNLLYFALSNLDAATYQVCYQLKILTTALFSVILLQVRPRWR